MTIPDIGISMVDTRWAAQGMHELHLHVSLFAHVHMAGAGMCGRVAAGLLIAHSQCPAPGALLTARASTTCSSHAGCWPTWA